MPLLSVIPLLGVDFLTYDEGRTLMSAQGYMSVWWKDYDRGIGVRDEGND